MNESAPSGQTRQILQESQALRNRLALAIRGGLYQFESLSRVPAIHQKAVEVEMQLLQQAQQLLMKPGRRVE